MNKIILSRGFYNFAITKFKPSVVKDVVGDVAPHLNTPQIISTEDREHYREEHKIRFKRNPK